jgi:hypothetical protein
MPAESLAADAGGGMRLFAKAVSCALLQACVTLALA